MRTFQGEADTVGQTERPQTLDLREVREGLAQDSLAEAHAQALQRMKGRQIAHTCTHGPYQSMCDVNSVSAQHVNSNIDNNQVRGNCAHPYL